MEPTRQLKFLTYNVWSREDMVVHERMKEDEGNQPARVQPQT
ncbi:hypothetical protein ACP4OV_029557 [Aristida adscensionis]